MSAEAPAPQAHEEKLELQVETLEAAASPIDMLVELQVETLEAAASPIDVLVELQVETFDAPASSIDTLELSRDMLEAALEELELPLPLPLPLPTPQTVVARLEPSIDMLDETLHMHAAHDMRHAHDMHDTLELTDAMLESSVEISDADADALSAAAVSGRFGSELLQPAVRRWRDRGQWLGRRVVEIFSRA
jgi:hypothetical protein